MDYGKRRRRDGVLLLVEDVVAGHLVGKLCGVAGIDGNLLSSVVFHHNAVISACHDQTFTNTEGIGTSRSIDAIIDHLVCVDRIVLEVITDEGIDLFDHCQGLVTGKLDLLAHLNTS